MPKTLEEKLREKGWSEEEIQHALSIMHSDDGKGRRIMFVRKMNPILYWTALIVAIIGNFIISIALIPILLVLSNYQLYLVIAVLAVSFGAMFNLLIHTIEYVDPTHHIIAGIFIPSVALITIFIMVNIATKIGNVIQNPIHENPFIIGLFYVFFFMIPYSITKVIDIRRARKSIS